MGAKPGAAASKGARPRAAAPAGAPEGVAPARALPVAARYRPVWDALGTDSRHVDELAATCVQPVAAVLSLLLELELDGRVVQLGGGRFRRAA